MLIYLDNNQQISGSDLLSAILRYDLVPIPVTLELTVNATDTLKNELVVGKSLLLANGVELAIVKVQAFNNNAIKEGKRLGALAVIAVIAGCEPLLAVTKKATIRDSVNLSEIYRSLGAKARFLSDIKINRFVCLKGQMPTKAIALALQKESAVIVYDSELRGFTVRRINELVNQQNPTLYDPSQVQWLSNPSMVSRLNTNFLSIDSNGSDVLGEVTSGKKVNYIPRVDNRELNNLKRILVTRGIITRPIDERLQAGKAVVVNGTQYVVLTSAIRFDTGALGGSAVTATKAWLANMVEN